MTFWKNFFTTFDSNSNSKNNFPAKLISKTNYKNGDIYIYSGSKSNLDLDKLESLCESVGWIKRPAKRVESALDNSLVTIIAFYKDLETLELIGFARATSDKTFHATIWDLVIEPRFQGQGLGKLLMYNLIEELRILNISTVALFADSNVVKFYDKLGFVANPNNARGMFWYPK
uniref:GCN5-like N-acetyltransferase n=1 Tax=Porphyridium sordidum TaxID=28024 RepID=A0A1C9CE05_PORSO|nr:GCN5-like N-acetyltransferase [Porphyridium sordidum]AOM66616.1 GCN5-like N-acetyltransferase [Porphyridium sordidum]